MIKNIIGKITLTVLAFAIAVNVFMLVRINLLAHADSLYRERKSEYILPDGLAPTGTKVSWDESSQKPSGWVVRFVSSGCIYCKMDFEWEKLVPLFERYNYRTILLLPRETDQFDEDQIFPETARKMAFVKMDWIKQFRFSGTPTIVVFDNKGRVL